MSHHKVEHDYPRKLVAARKKIARARKRGAKPSFFKKRGV